jgi:hypothetical protein
MEGTLPRSDRTAKNKALSGANISIGGAPPIRQSS